MDDLADQIDDFICTYDSVAAAFTTMDTLAMWVFAGALIALLMVLLARYMYARYILQKPATAAGATTTKSTDVAVASDKATGVKGDITDAKSKVVKSDISSIVSSSVTSAAPGAARSRFVSPTPPVRRRTTRLASPGPEDLRRPLRKTPLSPPVANPVNTEDTISSQWCGQVFRWLYSDLVIVNELLQTWIEALNQYCARKCTDETTAVELVRLLPDCPAPTLSNVYVGPTDVATATTTITMDCEASPVLQIRAVRQKTGQSKPETSHYKTTVSRFRGRLVVTINYLQLKGEVRVDGYPDVRISMNSVGAIKTLSVDQQEEKNLQNLIVDLLTSGLRETIYPIDFSIYSTCPRGIPMEAPGHNDPYDSSYSSDPFAYSPSMSPSQDYLTSTIANGSPTIGSVSSGRRLLVKVVRGEGLSSTAHDPYCVIEMDEPPQKNQTGARRGQQPHWDEHFLFELSNQSAEILFEVYDRPASAAAGDAPRFLGLGLVGVDELQVGPSSAQVLALQPRPYDDGIRPDVISGAIHVEFVFIEGAEVPSAGMRRPYKLKQALKLSPTHGIENGAGDNVADKAIRALEHGALAQQPSTRSTVIIHSVQKPQNRPLYKVQLNKEGEIQVEKTPEEDDSALSASANATPTARNNKNSDDTGSATTITQELADSAVVIDSFNDSAELAAVETEIVSKQEQSQQHLQVHQQPQSNGSHGNGNYNQSTMGTNGQSHLQQQQHHQQQQEVLSDESLERGRQPQKKRDFFGTIKRRLRNRAKSADRQSHGNSEPSLRSVSADRSTMMHNSSSGVGGIGGGNNSSGTKNGATPHIGGGGRLQVTDTSRRSSISESSAVSGYSSASAKTFVHESSTLVLETMENGVLRHFLVPLAIAQRPRWRRKGVKLHIYNDHTFVARHLSGSNLTCAICTRSIPRRPGKQGYECRDCELRCHKQCHVRAPIACSNPTILSTELSKLNSAAADRSIRKS